MNLNDETITLTRQDVMTLLEDYECQTFPDGHPLTNLRQAFIETCFENYADYKKAQEERRKQ